MRMGEHEGADDREPGARVAAGAERLGFKVVAVYADTMSGARSDRAAIAAVLTAAHRREFDCGQEGRQHQRPPAAGTPLVAAVPVT